EGNAWVVHVFLLDSLLDALTRDYATDGLPRISIEHREDVIVAFKTVRRLVIEHQRHCGLPSFHDGRLRPGLAPAGGDCQGAGRGGEADLSPLSKSCGSHLAAR